MSASSSFNQPMGQPISIHFIPSNLVVSLVRKTVVSFPRNQVVTLQRKRVVTLRGISSEEHTGVYFIGYIIRKKKTTHYYYKTNSRVKPCNVLADVLHRQFASFLTTNFQALDGAVFQEYHRLIESLLPKLADDLVDEESVRSVRYFTESNCFLKFGNYLAENFQHFWIDSDNVCKRSLIKIFFPQGLSYNKHTGNFSPLVVMPGAVPFVGIKD